MLPLASAAGPEVLTERFLAQIRIVAKPHWKCFEIVFLFANYLQINPVSWSRTFYENDLSVDFGYTFALSNRLEYFYIRKDGSF